VTIERCVLESHQHAAGWTIEQVRTTLEYKPAARDPIRVDIETVQEEHDEYYEAVAYAIPAVLGRAVLVKRTSHGARLGAYLLDADLAAIDLGRFDGVDVTIVDRTHASVTPCTFRQYEMSGVPNGPCEPDPTFGIRWTGATVERAP
jgi:hypothetical protein